MLAWMLTSTIPSAKLIAFLFRRIYWMNTERKTALAVSTLVLTAYAMISTPIAWVLTQELGTLRMGVILTLSSAVALFGYQIGGFLCNHLGGRIAGLVVLPLYMGNLTVFLIPNWFTWSWISFGLINGVVYTAVDGLFRESIDRDSFGEHLISRKAKREKSGRFEIRRAERFASAFATSALINYLMIGLGSAVAIWLINLAQIAWVMLPLLLTGIAYAQIWSLPAEKTTLNLQTRLILWIHLLPYVEWKKNQQQEKEPWKNKLYLYRIASPYLGLALANAAFLFFLPMDPHIGIQAGLILMVAKITNGLTYLLLGRSDTPTFHWSVGAMVVGMLLITVARMLNPWLSLPLCLLAAVMAGWAMSVAKLKIKLQLQLHASEKGSATAPQAQISELGYLIAPIAGALLLQEWGHTTLWISAAGVALLSLYIRKVTT